MSVDIKGLPRIVSKLYKKNDNSSTNFVRFSKLTDTDVKLLNSKPLTDFNIDSIENYKHKEALLEMLIWLPLVDIEANFGENLALWVWANDESHRFQVHLDHSKYLISKFGNDSKVYTHSQYALEENFKKHKTLLSSTQKLVDFTKNLNDIITQIDVNSLLLKNYNNSEKFSKEKSNFELEVLQVSGSEGTGPAKGYEDITRNERRTMTEPIRKDHIYLDSSIGLLLKHKGKPQTFAAYALPNPETLMIIQTQGHRPRLYKPDGTFEHVGGARELYNLDHKQFWYDLTEAIAKSYGFSSVGAIGSSNIKWAKLKDKHGKLYMTKEAAKAIYDSFAIKNSMVLGKDKNWYKPLTNSEEHKS